jgi:hypothetical protein
MVNVAPITHNQYLIINFPNLFVVLNIMIIT